MLKWIFLILVLALPVRAQFAHRSTPGDALGTPGAVTATTPCPGAGCVTLMTGGADTAVANISGTWAATLNFACSNDGWVNKKAALAYPFSSSTGLITGAPVTSTTANGDWFMSSAGFRECGIYATAFTSNTSMAVRINADPVSLFNYMLPVPGTPVQTSSAQSSTAGTQIACNSGVSPCTVTTAALTVLNANAARRACQLCAWDVVDLYCKRNTSGGSAASATNADFALNAGSATKKIGGCWSCDTAGAVWTGAVNCIASGASAVVDLQISETQ